MLRQMMEIKTGTRKHTVFATRRTAWPEIRSNRAPRKTKRKQQIATSICRPIIFGITFNIGERLKDKFLLLHTLEQLLPLTRPYRKRQHNKLALDYGDGLLCKSVRLAICQWSNRRNNRQTCSYREVIDSFRCFHLKSHDHLGNNYEKDDAILGAECNPY